MAQDNQPRPAFEAGAEEELERIRRALDESRQRRREANEAFDAFLRSFGPRSGREPRPVDPRSMDVRSVEAPSPAPVPGGSPAPPPSSAPEFIGAPSSAIESQPPITGPPPIAKAPEPPVDEPGPFVSAPPIAERQPLESAALPPGPPRPPPDNASRPSADTTPPPASDTPPLVSALEGTASVTSAVPSQSSDAPLTVPVPALPPIAAPAAAGEPEAAASDPGQSWIPEPTTPLRLIQEDGTLESLLAEPSQISRPAAADPRGLYPAIPSGLRQSLQGRGLRREHVAAAVVLVVLAVLLIWSLSSTPDDGDAAQRPAQPSTGPAATASAQQPAASAPPISGLQVELRTVRHVWVRVVVDGEKTIEREIPADERIPINGQNAVVIRAGDAGAVRVAVNGQDQGAFGDDGFPATRTFTRAR
jgi:hypothetical protein